MLDIISCSRRTDIPAFYYEWLQESLKNKYAVVKNPYNQTTYRVDLSPEKVHSICLWSKSFTNIISDPGYLSLYNLYFQFTITGYSKVLESKVIDSKEAVRQMGRLSERYSPQQINWRFDPIILSDEGDKNSVQVDYENSRLKMFDILCRDISSIGVKRCTISYLCLYKKVEQRMRALKLRYIIPTQEQQIELTSRLVEIADKYGVILYTCSSPLIEEVAGVKKSHCIDGDLLEKLFGKKASHAKDAGQRPGCGCTKSKDIGAYGEQRCGHGCIYCYGR